MLLMNTTYLRGFQDAEHLGMAVTQGGRFLESKTTPYRPEVSMVRVYSLRASFPALSLISSQTHRFPCISHQVYPLRALSGA